MNIILFVLFIICPVISLPILIGYSVGQRFRSRSALICISIVLGLLSYAVIPGPTKDLYKHYLIVQDMALGGGAELLDRLSHVGGPALFYLITYVCAKLNIFNLMPLVMVSVTYSLYFLGMKAAYENCQIHDTRVILITALWVFSTLSCPSIISTLRQPLAVAVIFYFLQNPDMNKKGAVICLLAAIFLHVTGYFMLVCLLLSYLWLGRKYHQIAIVLFIIGLVVFILKYVGYDLGVEAKIEVYNNELGDEYDLTGDYLKYVFVAFLNACTFILLCVQIMRYKYWGGIRNSLAVRYAILFFCGSMFYINNPVVYRRLMFYLPLFGVSFLSVYLSQNKRGIMFWITLAILLLTIAYSIRLQWANFGGYEYWLGTYYRDIFTILIQGRNCFFISF